MRRKLIEAATQVAHRSELDRVLKGNTPIGVDDYDTLENNCLYKNRKRTIGDVWIWCEEDDTFYRQWTNQHMSMTHSGKTAYWSPYMTSDNVKPIRLRRAKALGRNAWMFNKPK